MAYYFDEVKTKNKRQISTWKLQLQDTFLDHFIFQALQ